jgi:ring-1,2-phenylacetyl-CoA epoxidase subunit PaaC
MDIVADELKRPLTELLLAVADDKLILGHRNSDWTGLGPILEEDIAFSALAQDDIAHAKALYEMAAELNGDDADRLTFGRKPEEYRCAEIVTVSDDFDWATALVRQFFCDHFERLRLARLAHSANRPLADLATKMAREEGLAIGHADQWIVRLCRASDESRARIVAGLDRMTPLTPTLFELTEGAELLEDASIYPTLDQGMFEHWEEMIVNVVEDAGVPIDLPHFDPTHRGGRRGKHGPHFAEMLDEMTEVYRVEPEAKW